MTTSPMLIDTTPAGLAGLIAASVAADIPLMVWGHAGLGKSRIIEQCAAQHALAYCDFRAMILDVPDLNGMPVINDMREGMPAPMTAPTGLPGRDAGPTLVCIEELPGAARSMQGSLYGLILERRLNGYSLPAGSRIVATGNLPDSGGVTQVMPDPLINRFMHVRLVCTPDEHLAYAQATGWHPITIGYHAMTKGTEWDSFGPAQKRQGIAFASPRSWEAMSRVLNSGALPADCIGQACAGILGEAVGAKFAAFVGLYASLQPTLDAMRTDPTTCPIPKDAASHWFLASLLAEQLTPYDAEQWGIALLMRLSDEPTLWAMDAACKRDITIARTVAFGQFAAIPRYAALARFV